MNTAFSQNTQRPWNMSSNYLLEGFAAFPLGHHPITSAQVDHLRSLADQAIFAEDDQFGQLKESTFFIEDKPMSDVALQVCGAMLSDDMKSFLVGVMEEPLSLLLKGRFNRYHPGDYVSRHAHWRPILLLGLGNPFTGGDLNIHPDDSNKVSHILSLDRGMLMVMGEYVYHSVSPVVSGLRQVALLVI